MYSSLSRGISNAPFYDQAARAVACMAATLGRSVKSVGNFESIGFYVVAPILKGKSDQRLGEMVDLPWGPAHFLYVGSLLLQLLFTTLIDQNTPMCRNNLIGTNVPHVPYAKALLT